MRVFFFFLLLFPLVELAVMIKVGSALGVLPTLALLALGGVVGVFLMRLAGVATAWRARERIARGELPDREMLQGVLMALAGLLLLLPGFCSDLLGLLILFIPTRQLLIAALQRRFEARTGQSRSFQADPGEPFSGVQRPNVIEGEWERRDS